MAVTINGSTGVTTPGISNSEGYTGDGLSIAAGAPAGALAVDSSGNIGVGVTPSAWNSSYKALQVGASASMWSTGSGGARWGVNYYLNSSDVLTYIGSNFATDYRQSNGAHSWHTAASGTAGNAITFTQAMTLDANGNLLVGTTSAAFGERFTVRNSGAGKNVAVFAFDSTDDRAAVISYHFGSSGATSRKHYSFLNTGTTEVGSISCNGTATAYNTSSDYRLKEDIQPMTGALTTVAALKPVTYKWKADGSNGQGFIAHELQEVVPDCVTGEKDAVDAEGKPVYQGIDTSFLVATLTAAIQELNAKVEAQAAEIAALKGKA